MECSRQWWCPAKCPWVPITFLCSYSLLLASGCFTSNGLPLQLPSEAGLWPMESFACKRRELQPIPMGVLCPAGHPVTPLFTDSYLTIILFWGWQGRKTEWHHWAANYHDQSPLCFYLDCCVGEMIKPAWGGVSMPCSQKHFKLSKGQAFVSMTTMHIHIYALYACAHSGMYTQL